jgi:hypothetical protein
MGGWRRRARRARATWAGVALAVPALWGCAASPLQPVEGGFGDSKHGYRIGVPPKAEPRWRRLEVEGSLLAFERPGPIRMTFSSRCGVPLTRPQLLARHLRIGIPAHVVRAEGPVGLGGLEGWQQVFDADAERGAVRVKTVTITGNGCAFDWVLIAREASDFEPAERDFDAWWQTFALDPAPVEAVK